MITKTQIQAYTYFKRLILLMVLTSLSILSPSLSWAQKSCRLLMIQATDIEAVNTSTLLNIGHLLKARAHKIDPVSTHLPELVPLVEKIREQTKTMLQEKKSEKLYRERKEILEKIISEMSNRISDKKVTYEWLVALGFRVAFLSRMSHEPRTNGPNQREPTPKLQHSLYYYTPTYLTHSAFMKAVRIGAEHGKTTRYAPLLANIREALDSFPNKLFLPAYFDLSMADINHLFAADIFPLGMTRKILHSELDRMGFDEFDFINHDLGHSLILTPNFDNGYLITPKSYKIIETNVLKKIDSVSGYIGEMLQVFHFMAFHEGRRDVVVSRNTLKSLIYTFTSMSRLNYEHAKDEVLPTVIKAMTEDQQIEEVRKISEQYIKILEDVVLENEAVLNEELTKATLHRGG